MKRTLILLIFIVFAIPNHLFAQQTKSFSISGAVKNASTITLDSIASYKPVPIGGINITNHLGDFKHRDEKLEGVLLKDILKNTKFDVASPKLLSELYFTCEGADGYKVVYSWNELYNTQTGDNVYIITSKKRR